LIIDRVGGWDWNCRELPQASKLLLEAAADARLGLGGGGGLPGGGGGGVEVEELLRLEGELGVARLVVDLHGLDVGRRGAAERAGQLRVAALVLPQTVRLPRLAAAPVRRRRVDLCGDLLRRVFLRLRLARHHRHAPLFSLSPPPPPPPPRPFLTLLAFVFFAVMGRDGTGPGRQLLGSCGRPQLHPAAVVVLHPPSDLELAVLMVWAQAPGLSLCVYDIKRSTNKVYGPWAMARIPDIQSS
jgi:hypothetical protein